MSLTSCFEGVVQCCVSRNIRTGRQSTEQQHMLHVAPRLELAVHLEPSIY